MDVAMAAEIYFLFFFSLQLGPSVVSWKKARKRLNFSLQFPLVECDEDKMSDLELFYYCAYLVLFLGNPLGGSLRTGNTRILSRSPARPASPGKVTMDWNSRRKSFKIELFDVKQFKTKLLPE